MTVQVLSDKQLSELEPYFLNESIRKMGIIRETGEIIIEYEYVDPYPKCEVSLKTIKISR